MILSYTQSAFAAGTPKAVLNAREGVVRIYTKRGEDTYTGTGFAISNANSGALIVTNYHVIENKDSFELYYNGDGPVELEVAALSPAQDIAVMRTAGKNQRAQAADPRGRDLGGRRGLCTGISQQCGLSQHTNFDRN